MGFWVVVGCIIGLLKSTTRWGDTNLGKEYARFFNKKAFKIANIEVEYHGLENLEATQPCIYALNHQSNFDMAVFGEIYPANTVIIGKKELIWIPFFGLFYKSAGNIMIDRKKTSKAKNSLGQVVEEIKKRNVCVWIFPEGTRNTSDKTLLPFKKGPFHMAISAQVPVVSLVASSVPKILNWKDKTMNGGKLVVKVLPPVFTTGLTEKDVSELANTIRENMQKAFDEANFLANS